MESKDKNGVYVRRHGIRLMSIKLLRNIKKQTSYLKSNEKLHKDGNKYKYNETKKERNIVKSYNTKEALVDKSIRERLRTDAYNKVKDKGGKDWMYEQVDYKINNIMQSYRLTGDIKDIAKNISKIDIKEIDKYAPEDPIDVDSLLS